MHPNRGGVPLGEARGLLAMGKARRRFERSGLMGGLVITVCSVWLCGAAASLVLAQTPASPQSPGASGRLLTAKEGRAIVAAAREQEQPVRGAQDCSHLVHQVYALAGFDYPYASSFDLYAGSESFARVKAAQAGDLIVWPGHAGIVFNAGQHSFYSLVRSGFQTEDYEGAYWRSRGRPRFFRYVVGRRGSLEVAATRAASGVSQDARRRDAEPVVEERSDSGSSGSKRSAKETSEHTAAVYGPPAPEVAVKAVDIPASIVIAEGRKQPTSDEVVAGVSELSSGAGNVLRTDEPLTLGTPVVIYDQLAIERVEIKRDHGWAHLQIDSSLSIANAGTDLKKRSEKVRWELRRTKAGWEAVAPLDRTYVPRDVAVRILAAQLAQLTQSEGAAKHAEVVLREEAQLANLLSALLENK
jgi:hypothetical protein